LPTALTRITLSISIEGLERRADKGLAYSDVPCSVEREQSSVIGTYVFSLGIRGYLSDDSVLDHHHVIYDYAREGAA
jgi:hypothetical protein